jgi:electron transport complex protein RnfC
MQENTSKASSDVSEDTAQKAAKQAAIAAAIARAKAAKAAAAASGDVPKNVVPTEESVKKEIAEIDARRDAVGLSEKPVADSPIDADKQAKIAAAIAKAKAAKAAADAAKLNKDMSDNKEC